MFTQETLINYISDYVKACNGIGIYFNKVILFGSYAKNKANQWSDIDLALISDNFTGMALDDWNRLSPANIKFYDIEPHPFPTDYFEKGDPFIDEIKKTGTVLEIH